MTCNECVGVVYPPKLCVCNGMYVGIDGSMVSNANRKVWENEFQRLVLLPNLKVCCIGCMW